ncbi:sensor histidine kinase [Marinobacter lipolyticus]|uniref:sensor histidine kinase n=1 Tax=Marinobacter lipolyticus TaxID=209639 RepID=UPI001BD097AD|nr:HAMP domain-containing sensor histidine kinase [Marinobacter lipolyticus]MBS8240213.1 sensor histidine kinase [Marinobacter lipolyticus]
MARFPAKTLYARLALGLFLLLVTVGISYSFLSSYTLRHYHASLNQEFNRDLARNLVADRNLVDEGRLDEDALRELFSLYMTINPSIEIYLLDLTGHILAYSADPSKIKRKRVSLAPIHTLLADMEEYPVLGDDPRSHDRRKVFSVTPVPSAETPEGYLYVVLRGEEYDLVETMARSDQFIAMGAWALVISLVLGLVAGLAVFHLLTRRLARLTRRVEAFADSDMTEVPAATAAASPTPARDEIDHLALRFEQMATRIAAQLEQLRDKDAERRQLVARVSHDLRTPLASVQGYIEALELKHDSLSAGERQAFLGVARRESHRLGRLVDELFELAALDARETTPAPEPFVLAELVHDVALKHGPAAARRGVQLVVSGQPPAAMAYGDLAMTERVLDNLIGNAIAFSPEGSRISLVMSGDERFLEVAVQDQGPGIPEQDLPHIFEPFYRGSAGESSGHSGLGLAIAERMMTLQGGSVHAENCPPAGACFTLRLPVAEV